MFWVPIATTPVVQDAVYLVPYPRGPASAHFQPPGGENNWPEPPAERPAAGQEIHQEAGGGPEMLEWQKQMHFGL